MSTRIITVSLNKEADDILEKVKERGVGQSEFMQRALKNYFEHGYQFIEPDNGSGGDAEPVSDSDGDHAI